MHPNWPLRIVRVIFTLLCGLIGWLTAYEFDFARWIGILCGLTFGGAIVLLDVSLRRVTIRHFSHAVFGLLIGLFGAFLVTRLGAFQFPGLQDDPLVHQVQSVVEIALYATLGFLGAALALRSDRDQFALIIPYVRVRRDASEHEPLLLDTNIVIDGRIPRLVQTGFLSGTLVIPRLVLDELQRLADSRDPQKVERGKRGLEVLQQMRALHDLDLSIHEDATTETLPVDTRLVTLARELNARLLTNDENLAQVARLRGITVLSLNELARALQATYAVGDTMEITLVKLGKDRTQAVGYLPDGAMIVVNNAASQVGQTLRVHVTGTTQTSAGRLVFAEIAAEGK
jgi:uncharacterized protein YacL